MVRNKTIKFLLVVIIFYVAGLIGAVITQRIIKQSNNSPYQYCLRDAKMWDRPADRCKDYFVETRGWPFPSIEVLHDGSTQLTVTEGCINPLDIFCSKNPNASRYNIPQLYFNASFLAVLFAIPYIIFRKLRR